MTRDLFAKLIALAIVGGVAKALFGKEPIELPEIEVTTKAPQGESKPA